MISDLDSSADALMTLDAQVCIVGAGLAGLFLARLLRRKGVQVVLLEAGSSAARSPAEMDQRCEQRGHSYRGADSGRSFGLGGTSVLWGGQLIPMAESDFGARPEAGFDAWPIGYHDVAKYYPLIRHHLGLSRGRPPNKPDVDAPLAAELDDLQRFGSEFDLRFSEWLPFSRRNFATSLARSLKTDPGLTVWLNATVTAMRRTSTQGVARIEELSAQSPKGNVLNVRASTVVICAGTLESTRLLLAFDEATDGSITRDGAPLGRYFCDHLSVRCGRFACRDRSRFDAAVAPIFAHGIMRTPRLELTAGAQRNLALPSAFVHLPFVTAGDTGFDVVRNILMRDRGKRPLRYNPRLLVRTIRDVGAMAYSRGIRRRLWIPGSAERSLQVDIEQAPNPASRLYLSPDRDALDRKRLVVDWRILPSDLEAMRKVAGLTLATWRKSPLKQAADLELSLPEDSEFLTKPYDVYHPAGSTRMGASPKNSVVDGDLCLWSTRNCFVASTSVFPSMGSANPGLTHLALTARLAEKIAWQLSR